MATRTTTEEIKTTFDVNSSKESYYDTFVLNEPRFLAPIRRVERNLGFVTPIMWINSIFMCLFNILIPYLLISFLYNGGRFLKETVFFVFFFGFVAGIGITAGIHRLWSHRSYKVKTPLKILLFICYATAGQNRIYEWVRDHRVHHKRSETSADPHDANRGFFFAHFGWLMMKKHPHVIAEGSKIDMSDITGDPMVVFFDRHFNIIKLLCCFIIPTMLPVLYGEKWYLSLLGVSFRWLTTLNFTWSVNSFAHLYGPKPYDKNIMPSQNIGVSLVTLGEGSHNYHHTFPWDYKSAELPYFFNIGTAFLDAFALIGQAYDMKVASPEIIKATAEKRGDSSWQDPKSLKTN